MLGGITPQSLNQDITPPRRGAQSNEGPHCDIKTDATYEYRIPLRTSTESDTLFCGLTCTRYRSLQYDRALLTLGKTEKNTDLERGGEKLESNGLRYTRLDLHVDGVASGVGLGIVVRQQHH